MVCLGFQAEVPWHYVFYVKLCRFYEHLNTDMPTDWEDSYKNCHWRHKEIFFHFATVFPEKQIKILYGYLLYWPHLISKYFISTNYWNIPKLKKLTETFLELLRHKKIQNSAYTTTEDKKTTNLSFINMGTSCGVMILLKNKRITSRLSQVGCCQFLS